jgi:AcrR family transcriptional regulator
MPKKVDHTERRRAFANAAIEVIGTQGLDAVRLVDVARVAGATTGSLTHYFNDKDQLIAAALEEVISQASQRGELSSGGILEMVSSFLPLDEEGQFAARVWLAFFDRALTSETLAAIHRQYYDEFQTSLVERLSLESNASREQLTMLADTIIAIVDGLLVRATLDPEGWPARKQLDHLDLMLRSLLSDTMKVEEIS